MREEQWQEDWAFILSLASQVRMPRGVLRVLQSLDVHAEARLQVAWEEQKSAWLGLAAGALVSGRVSQFH